MLGIDDGVPKTPEWQESETGVAARDVRALARSWANKKTYLSCGMSGTGFGGACRGATGTQWARCMILMMAMQGWGKPGIIWADLWRFAGGPAILFPATLTAGISENLNFTGSAISNYQRMPHILTVNPCMQQVPKQKIPEAIIDGEAEGYLWDGMSQEGQFVPFQYPLPGFSPIHMIYRYGSSAFSTTTNSGRFAKSYRHDSIEFVVNQTIFMEGEAQFADVILPACSNWSAGIIASGTARVDTGCQTPKCSIIA